MAITSKQILISDLTRTATLLSNSPSDDNSGTQADGYTTILTTRCSLDKLSGYLDNQMGALFHQKKYRMICRYQVAIVINSDSLWQIGSEFYRVIDHTRIDDIPEYYEFILQKE